MILYRNAVQSLVPEGTIFETIFDENGWRIGKWGSSEVSQPTKEAIQAKLKELEKQYADNEYQRKRLEEYPSIQELVVALYDADDKAEIDKKRAEIKKKYPKPE
jgi:hypothetical protein